MAIGIAALTVLFSVNWSVTDGHYFQNADWIGSLIYATAIVMPLIIITDKSLSRAEQSRIGVIYIIAFFVIFFWAAYEQAGASLTFFADEQTDRYIGGWEMPAAYFQSFNPIMIVTLAPIFAAIWSFLGKRGIEPSSPRKQAIGLFLLSLGYLFIAFGVRGVEPGVKVSMIWLTGLYLIHTMGELCLAPIGLSLVYKLSPVRFSSLLMGVWYLSTSAANKFAGVLSGYYPEQGVAKHFLGYPIVKPIRLFHALRLYEWSGFCHFIYPCWQTAHHDEGSRLIIPTIESYHITACNGSSRQTRYTLCCFKQAVKQLYFEAKGLSY